MGKNVILKSHNERARAVTETYTEAEMAQTVGLSEACTFLGIDRKAAIALFEFVGILIDKRHPTNGKCAYRVPREQLTNVRRFFVQYEIDRLKEELKTI